MWLSVYGFIVKKNLGFILLSGCLIFLRMLDAYLTYIITPDLSFEANPLIVWAKQGWEMVFFANVFVVMISILLLYFSKRFPPNSYPTEKDYSFKEFVSHYLYNDKFSFHKIYFFVPKNKKTILNFCGYLFPRVFIFWSIIIIIHNLGIIYSASYQFFLFYWNLWIFVYMSLVPLTFYFFWKFFRLEYKKYKFSI